ncbi:YndM family protein [Psychrobacillus sp. NPDC096426]|uniref:YndM family protein n=1 Tax=Psychrobacillus sp. NPDC096426 TaxID=3364491 RepID=UPI00380E5741
MHIKTLLMKFVMITVVLWIILGFFYRINFTDILITSGVLTVVGVIGDMFVLPQIGNILGAIVDFFLALVVVCLLGANIFDKPIALATASFISALAIMMGELFLHQYMDSHIFVLQKKTGNYQRTDLQTEFAEEMDIDKVGNERKRGVSEEKKTLLKKE